MTTVREDGVVRRMMAFGVDQSLAERLAGKGKTVAKLRKLSAKALERLGLSSEQIEALHSADRVPIPRLTLANVLSKSAWCCCVCRDRSKSIILHHIEEWSHSRNNAESNLAVLCLQHHDEAHTKRALSISLTADRLRMLKKEWEAFVADKGGRMLVANITAIEGMWDFINVPRIYEIARKRNVDLANLPMYPHLLRSGLVLSTGDLAESAQRSAENKTARYFLQSGNGLLLGRYLEEMINAVLSDVSVLAIDKIWSREELSALVEPGMVVCTTGAHRFKRGPSIHGNNQIRTVRRKAANVELTFPINAWFSMTSTSHSTHLSGNSRATSVVVVREVQSSRDGLLINGTCLGICTAIDTINFNWIGGNSAPPSSADSKDDDWPDEL